MAAYEQFEQDLREGLAHLYDPAYRPSALLLSVLGHDTEQSTESAQAVLIQAIEGLAPGPQVPATARIRRIHQLLSVRYLQNLCQDEAAERLAITPRHLRREQQQAISVLARRLWEESRPGTAGRATAGGAASPGKVESAPPESEAAAANQGREAAETDPTGDWRSQVKEEVACLQRGAPGGVAAPLVVANVAETMRSVVDMARALTAKRGIALRLEHVEPELMAAVHPSGLRAILLTGIMELARDMTSGDLALSARRRRGRVGISISACPAPSSRTHEDDLRELLATQGGALLVREGDTTASLELVLPSTEKVKVLVVDDNADLVHFYDLYTAGTQYQISNIQEGERAFRAIEDSPPGIIVLDVMLPDMDGWELLSQLHAHPATCSIPVIVCSVVREEELAMALGAALYVAKPVRRQQFLSALDQALNQAAAATAPDRASSAATC